MNNNPYGFMVGDTYLDAEVASSKTGAFTSDYQAATGVSVSPGSPQEFMEQPNKWGSELRIYFNSVSAMQWAVSHGIHVEVAQAFRNGYAFRINNNELWWDLVNNYNARLGLN